jgi:MFS family permease
MNDSEPTGTVEKCNKFPPGIPYIVGNEGAERFSYYGMRQILYIYLVALFIGFVAEDAASPELLTDARVKATQWTHLFMAGVYLFPMIGAILADRFLGKFRVILWVSLIYVAGHGVLAVGGRFASMGDLSGAEAAMIAGLVLIAVGSGGIKPCVSANVGDQFSKKNSHLITKVFQIFYFSINFGSFFASLLTPWLYKQYGAEVAFGVPGVLMAIATIVFWMGRKKFVKVPANPGGKLGAIDFSASTLLMVPLLLGIYVALEESETLVHAATENGFGALIESGTQVALHYWWVAAVGLVSLLTGLVVAHFRQKLREDTGFLAVIIYGFRNRKKGVGFWEPVREKYGEEIAEGPKAVLRIMLVFSMVSVFLGAIRSALFHLDRAGKVDGFEPCRPKRGLGRGYARHRSGGTGRSHAFVHVGVKRRPTALTAPGSRSCPCNDFTAFGTNSVAHFRRERTARRTRSAEAFCTRLFSRTDAYH